MDWNNINTDRDTSGLGPIEYDQSKVPSLIRKHADNVRTKTYGQEMREAQARNAEVAGLIANEAIGISNETKDRQDTVETQFNSVQQELTDKDPISAPEIIAARNGFDTLDERLTTAEMVRVNVKDFGVKGDGVTDDSTALQAYVDKIEAEGLPYMYIPNYYNDYLITKPIKFLVPDVRIFGDKGMQMRHPSTSVHKKGNILVSNSSSAALDLGSYRRSPYSGVLPTSITPAGSWTVEGLSIKKADGETSYVSNGVELTGQQNGPDRPATFRNNSFNDLKYGLYVADSPEDVTIMLANLTIDNNSFYNNDKGIQVDGEVFGANITNNNIENHTNGAVHGNFNGSLSINHNMLEAVKNPVHIYGNHYVNLESKGNYFEYHPNSDYLYKVNTGEYYRNSSVNIHDNINSGGINMEYPVVLTGSAYTRVNSPQFKVLFENTDFKVKKGSTVLNDNGGFYAINKMKDSGNAIYMDGGFERKDTNNQWIHDYAKSNFEENTPLGIFNTIDLADGFTINQPLTPGDKLIVMNLMIKSDPEKSISGNLILNSSAGSYMKELTLVKQSLASISNGEWVMVSVPFIISASSNNIQLKLPESDRGKIYIAAATSKNYGTYDNTVNNIVKIYPVSPKTQNTKGIFTPKLTSPSSATVTYTEQRGTYVKDKDSVSFNIYIKANISGTGSNLASFGVTSLPFNAKSNQNLSLSGGLIGYNTAHYNQVFPTLDSSRYVDRVEFKGMGTRQGIVNWDSINAGTVEVYVSGRYLI